jgi:hypothetical protein
MGRKGDEATGRMKVGMGRKPDEEKGRNESMEG